MDVESFVESTTEVSFEKMLKNLWCIQPKIPVEESFDESFDEFTTEELQLINSGI